MGDTAAGFGLGVFVMVLLINTLLYTNVIMAPKRAMFQNVCEYKGGSVKEDLCVKGSVVIGKNKDRGRVYVEVK